MVLACAIIVSMTVHEKEIDHLGQLTDQFLEAAKPEHSQEAEVALLRVFTALSYDGTIQLDEIEKIVTIAGELFGRLNPKAGEVLTEFGQQAMTKVDVDSLEEFLSRKGFSFNYDPYPQLDFHITRDRLKWLTS